MKRLLGILLILGGMSFSANSQLPNGSIAPDFTLTDINGTQHHLYDYLNQGKAVVLEFFACHCPTCWNYHLSGRLDSLNLAYGPSGTNQLVVLMIEYDENNGANEFNGTGGWTAGDWVTGNSVPMINVEGSDRSIFDDYDMVYFTQLYMICPDRTTKLMFASQYASVIYQAADDCPGELSLDEFESDQNVLYNIETGQIWLNEFQSTTNISMTNSIGERVKVESDASKSQIDISGLRTGIYFLQFEHSKGIRSEKVLVP